MLRVLAVSAGCLLATFIVGLDDSIVSTALPTIATDFGTIKDIGWYGSAYFLPQAVLQPLAGKIYALWNIKLIYLTSLVVFEVGSIVSATATSSDALIGGRTLAGIGAVGITVGGLHVLRHMVQPHLQNLFVGAVFAVLAISSCLGPLLGGVITQHVGWHWCFWINLPIGGTVIALVLIFLTIHSPTSHTPKTPREQFVHLDLLGTAGMCTSLVALLVSLELFGSWPATRRTIIGLLTLSGAAALAFAGQQWLRKSDRIFPKRLVRNRHIWSACGLLFFQSAATMSQLYFLPFFFQSVQGDSATASGLRTIAYVVSMSLGAVISGGILTLGISLKPLILVGTSMTAIAAGFFSTFELSTSLRAILGFQVLAGLGAGFTLLTISVAPQTVADPKDVSTAQAIILMFEVLGGAVAVQVSSLVFTRRVETQISSLGIPLATQQLITSNPRDLRSIIAADILPTVLAAFTDSFQGVFYGTIAMCGVSWLFAWCVPFRGAPGSVGGLMAGEGGAAVVQTEATPGTHDEEKGVQSADGDGCADVVASGQTTAQANTRENSIKDEKLPSALEEKTSASASAENPEHVPGTRERAAVQAAAERRDVSKMSSLATLISDELAGEREGRVDGVEKEGEASETEEPARTTSPMSTAETVKE